jgi:hypothetical protein
VQYLGTNEIGFDPDVLGFPSVKTCQAIVYETATGLYGLHDALGNPRRVSSKMLGVRAIRSGIVDQSQISSDLYHWSHYARAAFRP